MKKALAMLLTLAMALSMLPMAFADVAEAPLAEAPITVDEPAPADTAPVPTEEAPLADVDEAIQTAGEITASVNAGETAFERLKTSIADAAVNGTVTLTENVDCGDKSLAIDKNITLDLNGRTISGTNTAILVAGPATIKNGTVTGGNTGIVATTVPLAGPGEHETPERAGDLILQDVHVTGATRTAVEVGASYANSNLFNGHVVVKSTKSNGTVLTGGIGGI